MIYKWLDEEDLIYAGFNGGEPSIGYFENGKQITLYLGRIDDLNIAILEVLGRGEKVYRRWYFGTFEGRHSGECENSGQLEEFNNKVSQIITRKNRIAGRELESKLWEVLNPTSTFERFLPNQSQEVQQAF